MSLNCMSFWSENVNVIVLPAGIYVIVNGYIQHIQDLGNEEHGNYNEDNGVSSDYDSHEKRNGYDDDYCHYDSNTTDEDGDNDNGDDDDDSDDDGQRCIECNEVELNGSN